MKVVHPSYFSDITLTNQVLKYGKKFQTKSVLISDKDYRHATQLLLHLWGFLFQKVKKKAKTKNEGIIFLLKFL